MEIKTFKDYRVAKRIFDDLRFLIDHTKGENQDYIDVNSLENIQKTVNQDIKIYLEKQKTECPDLKVGAIIQICKTDGISGSTKEYYSITNLGNINITCDLIRVTKSDFGNQIILDKNYKLSREVFIKDYNRYPHSIVGLKEWYRLIRYTEQIPWSEEN